MDEILKQLVETNKKAEQEFVVVEDKLYHKKHLSENQFHFRLYVPHSLVQELLQNYHESPLSGHAGIFKTYKRLYEVAYWPGMWTDVKTFIQLCAVWQSLKADNQKPAVKIQQTKVTAPNEMLGIDLMGPLPTSPQRHEYLLVVVDYFTRWLP